MLPLKRKAQRLISKNKEELEKELGVQIILKQEEIEFKGEELKIYEATQIIEAINRNFPIRFALLLLHPEYILENIPIKRYTRKNRNLKEVRARIIGTQGKALRTITELSDCHLSLNNNTLSIIGEAEKIKEAENAVTNLIQGAKHSKVYSYLEEARKNKKIRF